MLAGSAPGCLPGEGPDCRLLHARPEGLAMQGLASPSSNPDRLEGSVRLVTVHLADALRATPRGLSLHTGRLAFPALLDFAPTMGVCARLDRARRDVLPTSRSARLSLPGLVARIATCLDAWCAVRLARRPAGRNTTLSAASATAPTGRPRSASATMLAARPLEAVWSTSPRHDSESPHITFAGQHGVHAGARLRPKPLDSLQRGTSRHLTERMPSDHALASPREEPGLCAARRSTRVSRHASQWLLTLRQCAALLPGVLATGSKLAVGLHRRSPADPEVARSTALHLTTDASAPVSLRKSPTRSGLRTEDSPTRSASSPPDPEVAWFARWARRSITQARRTSRLVASDPPGEPRCTCRRP